MQPKGVLNRDLLQVGLNSAESSTSETTETLTLYCLRSTLETRILVVVLTRSPLSFFLYSMMVLMPLPSGPVTVVGGRKSSSSSVSPQRILLVILVTLAARNSVAAGSYLAQSRICKVARKGPGPERKASGTQRTLFAGETRRILSQEQRLGSRRVLGNPWTILGGDLAERSAAFLSRSISKSTCSQE